jgi:hypothetical protein
VFFLGALGLVRLWVEVPRRLLDLEVPAACAVLLLDAAVDDLGNLRAASSSMSGLILSKIVPATSAGLWTRAITTRSTESIMATALFVVGME